jgi:hypothetical protein
MVPLKRRPLFHSAAPCWGNLLSSEEQMKNRSNIHEGQINDFLRDVNIKKNSACLAGLAWSEAIIYQSETAFNQGLDN